MAACCQQPSADHISLSPIQAPQNSKIPASRFIWEQDSSIDLSLSLSTEPYDSSYSTLPSPIESTATEQPSLYVLPQEDCSPDFQEDHLFDFGSCDDWANWDDALSPTTTDFFPELKMETSTPNMRGLELHSSPNQFRGTEDLSGVFVDDRIDAPLFESSSEPQENLYSTPLSWSPPTGAKDRSNVEIYPFPTPLSPRQQSRLIAQAMPSRACAYPPSLSTASSPSPSLEARTNRLKRKSTSYASEDDDAVEEESSHSIPKGSHAPKKMAHNMIEKRYRTNLNDKIAALRDSVPSLRIVTKRDPRVEDGEEDLDGLTAACKLNKATILSKATEYIAHIERRNRVLMKEKAALRSRIEAFEILMLAQDKPLQRETPIQH